MSNQFYNLLIDFLNQYFQKTTDSNGKFYLETEDQQQTDYFYQTCQNSQYAEEFVYRHPKGVEDYRTVQLNFGKHKLVIAATVGGVTADFLVTLRNLVSEQSLEYENTAILFVCHEHLASIADGSADVTANGQALHFDVFSKYFEKKHEEVQLSKTEKMAIESYLKRKQEEQQYSKVSFLDYQDVIEVINDGRISPEEYRRLGFFYEEDIEGLRTSKKMLQRLDDNHRLFEKLQNAWQYNYYDAASNEEFLENDSRKIQKLFDDKEEWGKYNFEQINKFREECKNSRKVTIQATAEARISNVSNKYIKLQNENTASGRRNYHVIAFIENYDEPITFELEFNEKLKKDKLSVNNPTSLQDYELQNKTLHLQFNPGNQVVFEKVKYEHEDKASAKYTFQFLFLPNWLNLDLFEPNKANFLIEVDKKKLKPVVKISSDESSVLFGTESISEQIILEDIDETIETDTGNISVNIEGIEGDNIPFKLNCQGVTIPISVQGKNKKVRPLTAQQIWEFPRTKQASFEVQKNDEGKIVKLTIGTSEYNVQANHQKYFEYEDFLIEKNCLSAEMNQEELCIIDWNLDQQIKQAYYELTNCFKEIDTIPSLSYWDEKIVDKAKKYLASIQAVIENQEEQGYLSSETKNIQELGIIREGELIYFTPLHPLMIAFQLEVLNQLQEEVVSKEILLRLVPSGLLNLFEYQKQIYKATMEVDLHQWAVYRPKQQQTIGETNKFLRSIVAKKLEQFDSHFDFLFKLDKEVALKINIVNITSDAEIFKGVLDFMMSKIKSTGNMPCVDVTIYQHESSESDFEKFSYVASINQLELLLKENYSLQYDGYDQQEILRMIQQNLSYRKYTKVENNIRYAHLSFYKMNDEQEVVQDAMNNQKTAYALSGLLNGSTTDTRDNGHNYFGAGTKYITEAKSELITFANRYNELIANMFHSTNQPYRKNITVMTNVRTESKDNWMQFLNNSLWMVFVEPDVEIEFFMEQPGVEIIHYSDQLTSTTKYDAITITSQIIQYKQLLAQNFQIEEEIAITNLLHSFNALNGDWLLNLFGMSLEHGSLREKMSVISAAKLHTAYLNHHSDIHWIPISLEEIVRVSGSIGLASTSSAAPFSIHNLGKKGQHSDDLLFIGFKYENEQLQVYFHVCEVKMGSSDQSKKAYEQLCNTIKILADYVVNTDNDFTNRFYQNFFVQQALATYSKLETYNLYSLNFSEYDWEAILTAIHDGEYTVAFYDMPGAHLHFDTETLYRQNVELGDDPKTNSPIYLLKYFGGDMDKALIKTFSEINSETPNNDFESIENSVVAIDSNDELEDRILPEGSNSETPIDANLIVAKLSSASHIEIEKDADSISDNRENDKDIPQLEHVLFEEEKAPVVNLDIEIGAFANSTVKAKLGYLLPEINNKHMLVIGKSGSGKTYFIQRMLDEIAKRNISSLIIDYTRGFLPEHLDDDFIRRNNDKINQYFVVNDKCPINPFKKYSQKISGLEIKETGVNVGNRIKSIFNYASSSLGPQQLNDIYTVAKDGVNQKDEQFTMNDFAEGLKERNMSAYTQFQSFFDSDLFANESIDWDEIFDNSGKITIIQLAPYDKGIQKILTEFILWDLWHYALAKGEVSKSLPIVLDEAQNLDWNEQSPSYKFLTEGRKFGVSAWFATQSYAQLSKIGSIIGDNAATKVYFSVADTEIKEVAKRIKNKSLEESTRILQKLNKGEAVMDTLFLDRDNKPKLSTEVVKISAFISEE